MVNITKIGFELIKCPHATKSHNRQQDRKSGSELECSLDVNSETEIEFEERGYFVCFLLSFSRQR